MSALKRTWRVLALGGVWPAWAITRTFFWHPWFSDDIGNVLAALTAILFALTLRTAALPDLRDRRRKKDIAEMKAWQQAHEAAADERFADVDGRIRHLFTIMDAAASAAGVGGPDLETTVPQLRVVDGARAAG